ncbi:MAG TPA: hypothetical protein VKT80_09550 [Chloroflexota bacterium]|nr:hypothetical protein [Chloroflexota bacterium]
MINEEKLELLRVWYAIFVVIMDHPESPEKDIEKLRKLRAKIRRDAPGLDLPFDVSLETRRPA